MIKPRSSLDPTYLEC